ncbi:hypothetical protein GGR56DRAFT_610686 [Xylariaceae sp. FL0804]|nr:hypothetical protein GGR56DRAFT_610686 [Xylariaceae sp. FL0804]
MRWRKSGLVVTRAGGPRSPTADRRTAVGILGSSSLVLRGTRGLPCRAPALLDLEVAADGAQLRACPSLLVSVVSVATTASDSDTKTGLHRRRPGRGVCRRVGVTACRRAGVSACQPGAGPHVGRGLSSRCWADAPGREPALPPAGIRGLCSCKSPPTPAAGL